HTTQVKVYDVSTGKKLTTLSAHVGQVLDAAYSADGRQIVSTSLDRTMRVWNSETGSQRCFRGHAGSVLTAGFRRDGREVVSAGAEGTLKRWYAALDQDYRRLGGEAKGGTTVAFSPEGHCLAAGGAGGVVQLWSLPGRENAGVLRGPSGRVLGLAFA